MWPCIVTDFFITKPTRCINFTNLFWHETLHVSHSCSIHHQEFIHCTLSNGVCHTGLKTAVEQDQGGTSWSCSKAVYKPVLRTPFLSLQWINSWWWIEQLSDTCRISCQNKCVKLMHLFGFIIKKWSEGFALSAWYNITICRVWRGEFRWTDLWNSPFDCFHEKDSETSGLINFRSSWPVVNFSHQVLCRL